MDLSRLRRQLEAAPVEPLNEWKHEGDASDAYDGVLDTDAAPKSAKSKKRKIAPESDSEPSSKKHKRQRQRQRQRSPSAPPKRYDVDELFGDADLGDADAAAAAASEHKNGAPAAPAAPRKPLVNPVTGIPNWDVVDRDAEDEPSDDPGWIPVKHMSERTEQNVFFRDWWQKARETLPDYDLLEWLQLLQDDYYKDLWHVCDPKRDEDPPRHTKPFYKSAIFDYFYRLRKPNWFLKRLQRDSLLITFETIQAEAIARDGAGGVVAISKDHMQSLERAKKMLDKAQEDLTKILQLGGGSAR